MADPTITKHHHIAALDTNGGTKHPGRHLVLLGRAGVRVPQEAMRAATCVLEYDPDTGEVTMVKNRYHTAYDRVGHKYLTLAQLGALQHLIESVQTMWVTGSRGQVDAIDSPGLEALRVAVRDQLNVRSERVSAAVLGDHTDLDTDE